MSEFIIMTKPKGSIQIDGFLMESGRASPDPADAEIFSDRSKADEKCRMLSEHDSSQDFGPVEKELARMVL